MTVPVPPGHEPGRVVVSVPRWVASLLDPGVRAALVLVGLAVAGFVMLGFAWRGAARTIYGPLQLPWFASGSLLGLALVGTGLGGWSIHLGRRADAAHRDVMDTLVRDAAELAETLRADRSRLPRR